MDKAYQSYYTNSDYITDYMVSKLEVNISDTVLEPSVGEGIFVDKILKINKNQCISIYDIDDYAINVVTEKYSDKSNIEINNSNTLFDEKLNLRRDTMNGFSKIIGNPPYGAHMSKNERDKVNSIYPEIYSKDTYVLFFYRCLTLLKESGRMVFIIPDTFLYLNLHKKFRKFLFSNFCVEEILIFPSNLFPGISFAYSNLSIITVKKEKKLIDTNIIKIHDSIAKETDFSIIESFIPKEIPQIDILKEKNYNLHLNTELTSKLTYTDLSLGDIAECVTGIYTGNNKAYIKVKSTEVRNSKGYQIINTSEINNQDAEIDGFDINEHFIPIVKGSVKNRYHIPQDEWYIDWSKDAIYHYNTDKKARFQNSKYYFQTGIAIPMLKSKIIKAALMKNRVFDQSIVGIFPKNPKDIYFILALLNTNVVNDIIHNINPTVNNSANYLKRIPIPNCSNQIKEHIINLVKGIVYNNENNESKLNQIFENLYFNE
jgi:phospholipid N-methyltransferase